jgi:glycosyltransferase involved in cell wall biosynthesis
MFRPWTEEVLESLRRQNRWYRGAPAGDAPAGARRPDGVNLCGYFRDESGWGAAGRGYLRALRALGCPLALMDLSGLTSNRSRDTSVPAFDPEHPYDVNLVCVDAGQHFAMQARTGAEFFEGRFNVGAWAWELPGFPASWYDRFAYYDEIWVGTSFIANALTPVSPVPVVRIPPVLAPAAEGSRDEGRRRLGLGRDDFAFLFVFDFHSHLARKNPLATVDAFRRAFRPSDRARLILKTVNGRSDPEGLAALSSRVDGVTVSLHDGYWPARHVRDLMAACDAYISLHRSEGTGLTITDAMALGKPVIATGWSGNMDFMSVSNSFPVRFELTEIRDGVGPYHAGGVWAEPSVAHAAELMRQVFEDRESARARGLAARRDIAEFGSEDVVASLIRRRLALISHREALPSFRRELRGFYAAYRGLGRRLRDVVAAAVPPGAMVLVVSKGDEDLVRLEGRRAWHFPCTRDGTYAGYHPSDSDAAVAHLLELIGRGADHLVFPGTAFWWLDHYGGLRRHLEESHHQLSADDDCVIYRLTRPRAGAPSAAAAPSPADVGRGPGRW